MANQRAEGQVYSALWLDERFVALMDLAAEKLGETRSQFIREACRVRLVKMGIPVPDALASAPSRAGKGGPRRTYPVPTRHEVTLNEPSSTPTDDAAAALKKIDSAAEKKRRA